MITFKKLETIVQIIAIFLLIFVLVAFKNRLSMDDFLPAYVVVGIYQLVSTVINALLPFNRSPLTRSPLRKVYYGLLALTGISLLIAIKAGDALLAYLLVMLYVTPLMALFYVYICYRETYLSKNTAHADQKSHDQLGEKD